MAQWTFEFRVHLEQRTGHAKLNRRGLSSDTTTFDMYRDIVGAFDTCNSHWGDDGINIACAGQEIRAFFIIDLNAASPARVQADTRTSFLAATNALVILNGHCYF